jgi:lipopolysaccharide/colanic/teichoic acid biosynthesis glycosyltransferase
LNSEYAALKRALDVVAAVLLLIAGSPALLTIALLIYLEDWQRPIYAQRRAGKHHQPFVMYKFRSMKVGTPSISTEDMQQLKLEPYTRLGRFLRRTSLDELPQLWNVLRGEMSFIGPRPALLTQTPVLEARVRDGVDALLPGLTGLAQVSGRDDLSDGEKVRLDALYLEHFGLGQDWDILVKTAMVVSSNRGNK